MTKILYVGIALFFLSISAFAQTRTTSQAGPWDNPATWGGLSVPDNTFGAITINHAVTVSQTAYPSGLPLVADQVTIGAAGSLTIDAGAEMQLVNGTGFEIAITAGGTFDINGGLLAASGVTYTGTTTANVNFFSGSYHTTSTLVIPNATWNVNTNVSLTGFTTGGTATNSWSNVTGNVSINCPALTSAINFGGFLNTIQSLDIQATNTAGGGNVIFRSGAGTTTATINAGFTLSGDSRFYLATGGTQTLNLSGDFTFNPSTANYSQLVSANNTVGTINFVNGNFLMSAGDFRMCASGNASTTGTFNFQAGSMLVSGGTINEQGSGQGVINFTAPTGDQSFDLPANGIVSGSTINMTIDKATSGGVTFNNSQTLGSLTLTNGRLLLSGHALTINGIVTTTNGVIDPSLGSITLAGSGAVTGTMLFEDNSTMSSFTMNRAGTADIGNVTPSSEILTAGLTLSAGTLQKVSGTLAIQDAGTVTRSAGTLTLGSPIVPKGVYDIIYVNNGSITTGSELTTSATAIRNFTKQGTATLTLDKDLTAGNSGGTVLISTGTFSASTFTTTLNGSVNTISATANFAVLNVNGPLTQSSATTTTISGNLAVGTGGSLALTNGTTTFGGTTTITNTGSGAIAFNIVNISNGSTLTAPSGTISIANNFTGNGTFANGSGTVVFNGTTTLSGSTKTFNNITINNANSLTGAISWRVDGNLVNNGSLNFTAGTLTWGGTGTFSGTTPALTTVNNLTVPSSGVLNLTLAGNMTIGGNLTLTATAPSAIFNHQTANDLTIVGSSTFGNGTTFTSLGRVIFQNAAAALGGNATSTKSFTSLKVEAGATLTVANNSSYSFTGTGTLEVLGTLATTTGGTSTVTVSGNTTIINTGISTTFTNVLISGSLTATGTLNLNGNFTNNGTFNPGTGTVVFANGANGVKTIGGSQPATFNNITVQDNTANPDVSVSGTANLQGVLTLNTNAVLDADGAGSGVLTLLSTSDNPTIDASIATLTGTSAVTGNVTVQRFMTIEGPNAGKIYRYISAPVQNAAVSDMQNEIPVTGPFTGTSPCSGCTTSPSMYLYNETVITDSNLNSVIDLNDGYESFPAAINSETFAAGRGYSMYIRANLLSSALWDLRGTINQGNVTPVTLPTTFTSSGVPSNDGWNLVGNPYASTIDWNAVSGWTKTNVGGSIYMRDNGSSVVSSWNGTVGTNGGTQYISLGQAFWVQTTGAPVLTADENVKVAGTQTTFIRGAAPTNLLRITMSDGTQRDETVIHFRSDAKAEYDIATDTRKLSNPIFNLSTILSTGEVLAINSSPFTCSDPVKLNIYNAAVGTYQLNFTEIETFGGSADIILTDNFLNKTINVAATSRYDFEVTTNAASTGANRFFLTFSDKTLPSEINLTSQPACDGESATLVLDNPQVNAYYQVYKDGLAISDSVQASTSVLQLTVDKKYLTLGSNNVIIKATGDKCWNTKTYQGSVSVNEKPSITVTNGNACKEGAITLKAASLQLSDSYEWFADNTSQDVLSTSAEYITPVISKSRTYYVSARSSLGCSTERVAVVANVTQFEDALITLNGNGVLESNYDAGNQWYFNGTKLEGVTSNSIVPEKSGTYSVEVSTQGCTSTADFVYTITAIGENVLAANGISVYPNPVTEKAYIDVLENKMDISRAVLYNSIGKAITEASWVKEGKNKKGTLDMENLPVGIYILHFFTADNRIVSVKIYKK